MISSNFNIYNLVQDMRTQRTSVVQTKVINQVHVSQQEKQVCTFFHFSMASKLFHDFALVHHVSGLWLLTGQIFSCLTPGTISARLQNNKGTLPQISAVDGASILPREGEMLQQHICEGARFENGNVYRETENSFLYFFLFKEEWLVNQSK